MRRSTGFFPWGPVGELFYQDRFEPQESGFRHVALEPGSTFETSVRHGARGLEKHMLERSPVCVSKQPCPSGEWPGNSVDVAALAKIPLSAIWMGDLKIVIPNYYRKLPYCI